MKSTAAAIVCLVGFSLASFGARAADPGGSNGYEPCHDKSCKQSDPRTSTICRDGKCPPPPRVTPKTDKWGFPPFSFGSTAPGACPVEVLYGTLLERSPDPAGKQAQVDYLLGGHKSWMVARNMALSPEFHDRFFAGKDAVHSAIELYYRLLLRAPESAEVVSQHAAQISGQGWQTGVEGFTDGPEFQKVWSNVTFLYCRHLAEPFL